MQTFFENKLRLKNPSTIIYGGVDTNYFHPLDKTYRVLPKINVPIDDKATLISYVGRLIWTKGITYYYETIKEILGKYNKENIVFVLAGPGELETKLESMIEKDHLTNQVFLTGQLNYEQVRNLLGISDIFVNPSHHNEGFPNTILEAGAAGCYVVATDNAGTNEVIQDKVTGSLIKQIDPMGWTQELINVIDNAETRRSISTGFRELLIQKFDWKAISDEMYELLIKNKLPSDL